MYQIGSGDKFTNNISEQLHIAKMNEAHQSNNIVDSIWQMLKHNDQCTGHHYMEELQSYPALPGWYNIESAKVFNILSITNKWQSTFTVHLLSLETIQHKPDLHRISQQVYDLRDTHVHECAEVSIYPHLEMHQKILEFQHLDSYFAHQLKRTWDSTLVDLSSDMIRMYSLTVYLLQFRMGSCTTVNDFTTLLLLSVYNSIAR